VELALAARRKRPGSFLAGEHALLELLWQQRAGTGGRNRRGPVKPCTTNRSLVTGLGIPFFHVPVTPDTRAHAEAEALRLLAAHSVDTIVLARYMQC